MADICHLFPPQEQTGGSLIFLLKHPGSTEMEEGRSAFVVIEYFCSIEQYPSGWELNPVGQFTKICQVFTSLQ